MGDFDSPLPKKPQIALALAVEGGLAVIALAIAWLTGIQPFDQTDSSIVRATGRGIIATLPMLLLFWLLVRSPWPRFIELREQVRWLVQELLGGATLAQLALVAALAGFGEELLFRGVLQPLVDRYTSPLVAIALVSVAFGLLHALSRLYFVFATLVSVYLGWLAWHFGDLLAPMLVHALYDFVALVWFVRDPSKTRAT